MRIDLIRQRLRSHRPVAIEGPRYGRAAVAVVLRDSEPSAEFVVIHRAHRSGDPWSGHMALPGGRQDSSDHDLQMTVVRETREEIGIDLTQHGELLGGLDDLRAIGRGRPLDLVISPFVYAVAAPLSLTLNHREVQSAFWIPLASLRRRDVLGTYRHRIGGQQLEHPAFVYQGHTIWGLTHRILTGLLAVIV
jgi:8-oxo-dGTP pyrophosphatase MutT (NUDIX family)